MFCPQKLTLVWQEPRESPTPVSSATECRVADQWVSPPGIKKQEPKTKFTQCEVDRTPSQSGTQRATMIRMIIHRYVLPLNNQHVCNKNLESRQPRSALPPNAESLTNGLACR